MNVSTETFLRSELSSSLLDSILLEIEAQHARLQTEDLDPKRFELLNTRRIFASQSLGAFEQDRRNWDQANVFVAQAIQSSKPIDSSTLKMINQKLIGSDGEFRNIPVYAGDFRFPEIERFSELLDLLKTFLAEPNPLIRASLVYIWTINVHPFLDGNGRSARLFADSILLGHGYLPLCFSSNVAGHVVHGYAERTLSLAAAVAKCLNAILHSYSLLLPRERDSQKVLGSNGKS